MAGALTVEAEQRILFWVLVDPENTLPFEQPILIKLMSANGSATAPGTEITGDSYVPVDCLFSLSSDSPGVKMLNTFAVEFDSLSSTTNVTVVGVEIWDSSDTAPIRVAYATFSPSITVSTGEPLNLAPGQVTVKIT